jgi:hypothetical protein
MDGSPPGPSRAPGQGKSPLTGPNVNGSLCPESTGNSKEKECLGSFTSVGFELRACTC